MNLEPTRGVKRESFMYRGILEISIWDAGGQDRYMDVYFGVKKAIIFGDVEIPIFVVDVADTTDATKVVFDKFLDAIAEHSPDVQTIYLLINKIDLPNTTPDNVYNALVANVPEPMKGKIVATPVSVREGSAQFRLLEIFGIYMQNMTVQMQKLDSIHNRLLAVREQTGCHVLLYHINGLLISTTVGILNTDPLFFLNLEQGSLESNIYDIASKVMRELRRDARLTRLAAVIHEGTDFYLILRELNDYATLVFITDGKDASIVQKILAPTPQMEQAYVKIMEAMSLEGVY
jgi:hypothetical protein